MSPTWTTTCSRSSPSASPPARRRTSRTSRSASGAPTSSTSLRDVVGLARAGGAEAPARRARPAGLGPDRRRARPGRRTGRAHAATPAPPSSPRCDVAAVGPPRARPPVGAGSPAPRPRAWWSAAAAPGGWPTAPDPVTVHGHRRRSSRCPAGTRPGRPSSRRRRTARACSSSTSARATSRPTTGSVRSGCSSPTSAGWSAWAPSTGRPAGSTCPPGLDLDQFSVVDVSEEQFDGDPAHSGDSIVRGPLEA